MSERRARPASPGGLRARSVARAPSATARAKAKAVALAEVDAASVATIMRALPDPNELAAGTLIVVPASIASERGSLARSVLAVFGRTKTVARSLRCSALLARGYVRVGAAEDAGDDLTWGYAPASDNDDRADEDDADNSDDTTDANVDVA